MIAVRLDAMVTASATPVQPRIKQVSCDVRRQVWNNGTVDAQSTRGAVVGLLVIVRCKISRRCVDR